MSHTVDYERAAARMFHPDISEKKITPKFVANNQAMIENDPSKSISSIAKDMGVSEFLIEQVIYEITRYFS